MPIQIECPSCKQQLRIPESAVGRQARCPRCNTAFPVVIDRPEEPPVSAPTPIANNPFDFSTPRPQQPSKPTNPFGELGDVSPAQPNASAKPFDNSTQYGGNLNPYAAPATGFSSLPDESLPSPGLPWEHSMSFASFFQTIKLVLLEPKSAFWMMHKPGSVSQALFFSTLGTFTALGLSMFVQFMFIGLLSLLGHGNGMDFPNVGEGLVGLAILSGVFIFSALIVVPVFLLLTAGIQHLFMQMVGATRRDYEVTLRVFCYSYGSCGWLTAIPCGGGLINIIWYLVVLTVGLAKAHETDTGKVVLAVIMQVFCCCGVAIGFGFLLAAVN